MASAEVTDLRSRVASLERLVAKSSYRTGGSGSPLTIQVLNGSGEQLERGFFVCAGGIDAATGLLTAIKPAADSDPAFLGIASHTIPSNYIGRVQVAGVAVAVYDGDEPTAGDPMGTLEESFKGSAEQTGAVKFLGTLNSGETLCYVLIPDPTEKLVVDHDHTRFEGGNYQPERSTKVFEGEDYGQLHDVWKIFQQYEDPATFKIANSIAQSGSHSEGWVWGEVINEYESGPNAERGQGRLSDVIGLEKINDSLVNIRTASRFNDGQGNVGPFLWDSAGTQGAEGSGDWTWGRMLFDGLVWRPAIKTMPLRIDSCEPHSNLALTGDCDCNCLYDPTLYQMSLNRITGPYRTTDSLDNYIEVICCLWDRVNLIFRLLRVMDCCFGNWQQALDDWLGNNFGTGMPWLQVVTCLQNIHVPACGPPPNLGVYTRLCNSNQESKYKEQQYMTGVCERLKQSRSK